MYPNSATTSGGQFSANFAVANLFNENRTNATDTLAAATANSGRGYATSDPPAGSYPVTIVFEFNDSVDLSRFYLWNNATNATVASKGIKEFSLKFFDAPGGAAGSGNQIGATYSASAAQGPTSGNYAAEQFTFTSSYSSVRSVELVIANNHIGSSWAGIRELAFEGETSSPPFSDPSIKRVLVYLLGGQSNADGYGDTADLTTQEQQPTTTVPFYHGNGGGQSPLAAHQWINLQPGSGSKSGNAGRFGPELSFGRDMDQTLGSEKSRIAIIKHTVGGTNLYANWKAGGDATTTGDGAIYQGFQSTVAAALADLTTHYPNATIQLEGMIWHQGEGDVNGAQHNNYQQNLNNFIADVRLTYGAMLRFVIVQLSNNQWPASDSTLQSRCDVIQTAQKAVADSSVYNGMTTTSDLAVI
ncbi:MAG: sialate O-acetylesterase, partial [Akkermansiaceae bacterium]